ncbi:hypothetical protein LDL77_06685 [Flagellimonas marinaquae]|uniref:Uncharacterized protein n=1 Tax=Flagellimonas aurea TaxID=2915619 RepID=A0ABS3FZ11_9FLAO|nr:hypothetical protein [Allomuricauda aurea]MBO0352379.1 hypothetical protein [Allomuricauda aurea]UBZ15396.1 hypothetical protein LDL77_06685 [Allomuricauda aquimarina]
MKKLFFFYFTILFILFSCSKGSTENPEPNSENPNQEEPKEEIPEEEEVVYFTIKVDDDYFSSGNEGWVVSHDVNNGNILDYGQLENGKTTSFTKQASSTLLEHNLSLVNVSNYNGNIYYRITSYAFVKSDEVWQLDNQYNNYVDSRGDSIGEISINANDLVLPGSWMISNKHGSALSGGSSTTSNNNLTSIFFENIPLFEENRYLFSVYDIYGEVNYLFMNNLNNGDNITFDGTQLQSFDNTVLASVPEGGEFFVSVYGFEEDQDFDEGGGYILGMLLPFENDKITTEHIKLGYLNTFNKYITSFTYSKDRFNFNFKKYGEAPLGIPMSGKENWNVEVIDNSVDSFTYNGVSHHQFSRQIHSWRVSSGERNVDYIETSWSINQGKFYYTFEFKLPDEILTTYPKMDIEGLNYESSFFHLNEYDYNGFLNATFVNPNPELLRDQHFYRIDSE